MILGFGEGRRESEGERTQLRSEQEYRARRDVRRFWAQLRKILILPAHHALGWRARVRCWRWMGVKLDGCYVGRDCLFDEEYPELITVEPGAVISWRVMFIAHDVTRKVVGPIRICRKAFIGAGAIILPGVSVGEHSIVAAGAVVTRSVPAWSLAAGVPARVVKSRTGMGSEAEVQRGPARAGLED